MGSRGGGGDVAYTHLAIHAILFGTDIPKLASRSTGLYVLRSAENLTPVAPGTRPITCLHEKLNSHLDFAYILETVVVDIFL